LSQCAGPNHVPSRWLCSAMFIYAQAASNNDNLGARSVCNEVQEYSSYTSY
jgi:hypothetical protein